MFRLYKLYLLHSLLMRMKAIEDNPSHPANKKRTKGSNPHALMAESVRGEPLVYEEYSDDENDGNSDGGGEEDDA